MLKIRTNHAAIAAALAAMAGLALPLAGCKTGGHTAAEPAPLAHPRAEAAKSPEMTAPTPAWAQAPAINLEQIIDRAGAAEPAPAPAVIPADPAAPTAPAAAGPTPSLFELAPHSDGFLTAIFATNSPAPASETPAATAPKTLPAQIEENAITLMGLLAQQTADAGTAWKAYLALAALDLVRPGSMPQVISPDLKGAAVLSPEEIATADAVRQFLTELAALPTDTSPQARSAKIAGLAEQVASAAPMRVTTAALCGRVMGYGQYLPLGTGRFLQGRPQRAIVYVEVANFGHRPITEGQTADRWIVNVSQALQLFHDADGTLAWSRPEEEVIETSRNKRRDFYLVNDITLPPTLSIGAYRLKIVMRDKVSGQVDEHVIPFEVVAEAALALESAPAK